MRLSDDSLMKLTLLYQQEYKGKCKFLIMTLMVQVQHISNLISGIINWKMRYHDDQDLILFFEDMMD